MSMQQSDKPLAIDLYAGLGGWSEGLLAEGFRVVGFDIERHQYGDHRYPSQLVIQDVRTLHGSQFKTAAVIVASPPCQEFSYMAMPWSLAKAKRAAILADTSGASLAKLTELFDTCFRIQREASEAAGHHIPLVVENVRGAQEWVGRARWSFGSFYLWGDVPALMPMVSAVKVGGFLWSDYGKPGYQAKAFNGQAEKRLHDGIKVGNAAERRWEDRPVKRLRDALKQEGTKGSEGYDRDHPSAFGWKKPDTSSNSPQRKFASAMIAKIPTVLSRHIASTFMPK